MATKNSNQHPRRGTRDHHHPGDRAGSSAELRSSRPPLSLSLSA
jgi:hypothetical protein